MTRHLRRHVLKIVLSAAIGSFLGAPARAQEFWAGKNCILILGTSVGSGYDTYGRAVGRHINKHIPGNPTVVPRNMPGAGSKTAAEYIAHIAPKDGSTIGVVFPGSIVEPLLMEKSKWRYDPAQLEYIGTANNGTRLCATSLQSPVKTFEDARRQMATMGSTAPSDSMYDYPLMLNALTGTRFKAVSGYKGIQDIALAVERGELDGLCGVDTSTFDAIRPDWLAKRQVNTFVQIAMQPNPDMSKLGIPFIAQFVPPENKAVMDLIISQQVFQRPFIAPPGMPADRLKTLQDAFMDTMKDPAFLAEAKSLKLAINPLGGSAVSALVKQTYSAPKDVIDRMARAIRE